jgi:hypothetical protein
MAHRVVIYGGCGNLGRSLITLFNKNNWVGFIIRQIEYSYPY